MAKRPFQMANRAFKITLRPPEFWRVARSLPPVTVFST
jgi:hypothetical protein